jgi:2-polyprenyl-3-methyl-5-hydroxy-6-metoxy-1,4-benzoquinol methylase
MATGTLDIQTATRLKQQAALTWDKGRYREVARRLQPMAVGLVDLADVCGGMHVLDAAAGNGNVAVEAAARGAAVTAFDLAAGMVAGGRARGDARGLRIDWVKADVESLLHSRS